MFTLSARAVRYDNFSLIVHIKSRPLFSSPIKYRERVSFSVEDPAIERNRVLFEKHQIQVFQPKRSVSEVIISYMRHGLTFLPGNNCPSVTLVTPNRIQLKPLYLGILSLLSPPATSTDTTLAYPLAVFVSRSIASNTLQPRLLHFTSPLTFHNKYIDSIV